ncbi:MAG: CPBP family intramembrane metalloprotease [Proteobacteria bacterium]|nr:CPBP family intramembrane metalloprotease [Pseudomonadota bacterium]
MTTPPVTPPPSDDDDSRQPLHFWHGLLALLMALFLMVLLSWGIDLVWGVKRGVAATAWCPLAISTALLNALFVGCATWVVLWRGWTVREVLLGAMRPTKPLGLAIGLAALGVIPAGILADEVVFLLHRQYPVIFTDDVLLWAVDVFAQAPWYGALLVGVGIAVFPAIGEEIMFRGALLNAFRNDMSAVWAVVYTSILFALVHFDWMQGTAAGLMGLYLGFVTVKTRTIYPAIAAHALNNAIAAIAARHALPWVSTGALAGYPLPILIAAAVLLIAVIAVFLITFRRPTTSQ